MNNLSATPSPIMRSENNQLKRKRDIDTPTVTSTSTALPITAAQTHTPAQTAQQTQAQSQAQSRPASIITRTTPPAAAHGSQRPAQMFPNPPSHQRGRSLSNSPTTTIQTPNDARRDNDNPSIHPHPSPPQQPNTPKTPEANGISRATLRDILTSQISLEILLKHDELRLIDQELAKCQVALEQLRRCHEIPYPNMQPDTLLASLSAGTGFAVPPPVGPPPTSPAPWGVTDGPYTRHYAKWLLPDARFDGGVNPPLVLPQPAAPVYEGRATRASLDAMRAASARASATPRQQQHQQQHPFSTPAAAASASASATPSTIGGAYLPTPSMPTPFPPRTPKDKAGPMVLRRKSDLKPVKLVCLDCGRENFSSAQGFINHCRIAHNRNFASHEAAAEACGVVVGGREEAALVEAENAGSGHGQGQGQGHARVTSMNVQPGQTVVGGSGGGGAGAAAPPAAKTTGAPAPSNNLVHPLINNARSLKETQPKDFNPSVTISQPNKSAARKPPGRLTLTLKTPPLRPQNVQHDAGATAAAAADDPQVTSPHAPHLSDLVRRKGIADLGLSDIVEDAMTKEAQSSSSSSSSLSSSSSSTSSAGDRDEGEGQRKKAGGRENANANNAAQPAQRQSSGKPCRLALRLGPPRPSEERDESAVTAKNQSGRAFSGKQVRRGQIHDVQRASEMEPEPEPESTDDEEGEGEEEEEDDDDENPRSIDLTNDDNDNDNDNAPPSLVSDDIDVDADFPASDQDRYTPDSELPSSEAGDFPGPVPGPGSKNRRGGHGTAHPHPHARVGAHDADAVADRRIRVRVHPGHEEDAHVGDGDGDAEGLVESPTVKRQQCPTPAVAASAGTSAAPPSPPGLGRAAAAGQRGSMKVRVRISAGRAWGRETGQGKDKEREIEETRGRGYPYPSPPEGQEGEGKRLKR